MFNVTSQLKASASTMVLMLMIRRKEIEELNEAQRELGLKETRN